jgi:hypothetical protein
MSKGKAMGKAAAAEKPTQKVVSASPAKLAGSPDLAWTHTLLNQAVATIWTKHSDAKQRDEQIDAVIAGMLAIGPADPIEAMLAAQMLASHNAAMECHRRAMHHEQTFEGRNMALGHAAKASRTFAALVEALNRHRGKGQQKVTVEHVHVHSGGQAIVGQVSSTGGRVTAGSEGQPHAAISHAAGQQVLGQIEAEREALPVASGARL